MARHRGQGQKRKLEEKRNTTFTIGRNTSAGMKSVKSERPEILVNLSGNTDSDTIRKIPRLVS